MKETDHIYDQETRKLFRNLLMYGLDMFIDKSEEHSIQYDLRLLHRMIDYFKELEEYEKCSTLGEFIKETERLHLNMNSKPTK